MKFNFRYNSTAIRVLILCATYNKQTKMYVKNKIIHLLAHNVMKLSNI